MKYVITYEHLREELVNNENKVYHFERVMKKANEVKIELMDQEFTSLFRLSINGKDIDWILNCMGRGRTFLESLVAYITY